MKAARLILATAALTLAIAVVSWVTGEDPWEGMNEDY